MHFKALFSSILFFVFSLQLQGQITQQPTSKSVCGNSTIFFKVKHTYTTTTSTNWQVKRTTAGKWVNLSNTGCYNNTATDSLIITNSPDTINGFEYRFFIRLTSGSDSSQIARLTINAIPSIPTTSNSNISLCKNSTSATLSATASTGCSLNWYTTANGGTPSSSAPTINTSTVGTYKHYVSQVHNTTRCESGRLEITITINDLPTIPGVSANNIYYCQNQPTTQLTATASPGCTLYWYSSSTTTSGTTTAPTPPSTNIGSTTYFVGQTNNSNLCESSRNDITVIIDALPSVTSAPSSVTICEGSNTSFTITATGTNLQYQWQIDNGSGTFSNISSAGSNPTYSGFNSATLSLSGVPNTHDGYLFRCVVTGKCNPSANSNAAKLNINRIPRITTQPSSVTTCEGTNTSFSINASGAGLQYQWQINSGSGFTSITTSGTNPSYQNFTTSSLSLNSVVSGNNGLTYRCIISGTCSPVATSNSTTLTVTTKPQIQTQPTSVSSCEGSSVRFEVAAAGTSLSYQWQVNRGTGWQDILSSGSTPTYSNFLSNKLDIDNLVQWNDGYLYRCVVTGACSPSATSNTAKLSVDSKPIIVAEPSNISICSGQNTQFLCDVTGTRLKYQWQILSTNGQWLSIDTTPPFKGYSNFNTNRLTIESVISSAKFRLQILNTGCTSAISNTAALTAFQLPTVTAGSDQEICSGAATSLFASSNSTGTTFEWTPSIGLSNNRINNPTVNILTDVTYKITVIDNNKCSNWDEVKITVNPLPKFTYELNKLAICKGDTAKLTVNTIDSFVWSPSLTTKREKNIVLLFPSQETIYNVSIFTNKKCSDNFNLKLGINPEPATEAGTNHSICQGQKYQMTASGSQFYQWRSDSTLSNPNISNPICNPLVSTKYFLTGTNIFGCKKEDSVTITVNPLPTFQILSVLESCADVPKQIKIKSSAKKINWEPNTNLSNPMDFNPIFSGKNSVDYNFTITDSNNCSISEKLNFIVHPTTQVKATANVNHICFGESVTLKTSIDTAFWSGPNFNSSKQQETIFPKSNSVYFLLGKNAFGCLDRDTITIVVSSIPKPQIIGDTFLCKNENWTEFKTIPTYSNATTKWTVLNGRFATGDVSENIAIHWGKTQTGKIAVTETMNNFPYCQGTTEKIVNLGKGECVNPTTIFVKGNDMKSGILISDNKTYGLYEWGYINKKTKVKTMTCTEKTWCDFKNIDTITNRYFLLSNAQYWTTKVCPTLTYFNPVRFVTNEIKTATNFISIYPNPADDNITVDAPFQVIAYEIIDNSGRVIVNMDKFIGNQINTSILSPGNYFIHLIGNNNTTTQKFLINR